MKVWLPIVQGAGKPQPLRVMTYIVAGDFNKTRDGLQEIAEEVGLPVPVARAGRIDHILAHGMEIVEACALERPDVPGDHDPVFATVEIKEQV